MLCTSQHIHALHDQRYHVFSGIWVSITTYNAVWPIGSLLRSHTHSKSFAQTKFSVAVLDKKTLS